MRAPRLIWQDAPQGEIPVRFRVSKKHSCECFLLTTCSSFDMDEQQRMSVFQAQTKNVWELHHAWKHVNRQINDLLVHNDNKAVEVNTKILAVIHCALAEAEFSKLIHTPHGLTLDQIEQIKKIAKANGVKFGWMKCAELAVSRVGGAKHNHRPNVLQKLTTMIEEFIYDPSLIRNKLAHGQWCVALNSENTAVNNDLTSEMAAYTVVDFYRRRHSLDHLAAILEDLIESPNRAHRRDYWTRLSELETEQREMSAWTLGAC
jgi:hypothetical protein